MDYSEEFSTFQNALHLSWVNILHQKDLIIHSFDTVSGLPEFAQINKVFIHHGNPYFLLTLLETLQFDSHYHSFKIIVKEPEAKIIIGLCDVVECEPLWIIETFEKYSAAFINVRHWVWVMCCVWNFDLFYFFNEFLIVCVFIPSSFNIF